MKKIQFIPKDSNEKEFAETLKKRVNDYFKQRRISTKGNLGIYLKAFILIGIYLLSFMLVAFFEIKPIYGIALAILMGIGEAGIGMSVMHDAAHGAYSRHKWVNSIFASTMVLLGSNVFNWKVQHNLLHHT